jgi:hypothetical protein
MMIWHHSLRTSVPKMGSSTASWVRSTDTVHGFTEAGYSVVDRYAWMGAAASISSASSSPAAACY